MIRNFVTRRHRFLAISLGMAATLAMLGLAFNITEADIDTDRHFVKHKHIARNLVVGQHITVCTSDYGVSASDAVDMWNNTLGSNVNTLLLGPGDAFVAVDACPTTTTPNLISYVQIVARDPSGSEFFCRNISNACLLMPPSRLLRKSSALKSVIPGLTRNPCSISGQPWIPAFAGMTSRDDQRSEADSSAAC